MEKSKAHKEESVTLCGGLAKHVSVEGQTSA
jgi:hypothetical protein